MLSFLHLWGYCWKLHQNILLISFYWINQLKILGGFINQIYVLYCFLKQSKILIVDINISSFISSTINRVCWSICQLVSLFKFQIPGFTWSCLWIEPVSCIALFHNVPCKSLKSFLACSNCTKLNSLLLQLVPFFFLLPLKNISHFDSHPTLKEVL